MVWEYVLSHCYRIARDCVLNVHCIPHLLHQQFVGLHSPNHMISIELCILNQTYSESMSQNALKIRNALKLFTKNEHELDDLIEWLK